MSSSSTVPNSSELTAGTEGTQSAPAHYLYPGALFADRRPHAVTTILGSCIAVCLWDQRRRIGGINHYLLPLWNGEGLPTPRYGNVAIDALVEKMLSLGCRRSDLMAKVFGGASMWENPEGLLAVGARNAELAERSLAVHGIPVVASSVGGCEGRKLVFQTGSGTVLLRRVRREQRPTPS